MTGNPVSNAAPIHSFAYATQANNVAPRQVPVPPPAGTAVAAWTQEYMAPYTNPSLTAVNPNNIGAASPIRASLNTDQFPVLWRAFWNVMCDDNNPGPTGTATGLPTNPVTGSPYPAASQIFTDPPDVAVPSVPILIPKWSQYDQLLIRAAIAAVNVEGLRDQTDNIISRHIILPDGISAEVFSNKPQPYILSFTNGSGGPGPSQPTVTLYNPMKNKTLNYGQYLLAYFDPATPTTAPTVLQTSLSGPSGTFTLALSPTAPTQAIQITSPIPPLPATNITATAEIILFRSRGNVQGGSLSTFDPYSETANVGDNVPLDYVLASGTTPTRNQDWSCSQAMVTTNTNSTNAATRPPIQIFNDDFPGPYSPPTAETTPNRFPFGVFPRVGDVLKVPFIGSYRVTSGPTASLTNPSPNTPYYIPVTLDCAACNTGVVGEQIGHFSPPSDDPTTPTGAKDYDWTKKIFDYFTAIQNPGSDYTPNVNPNNPTQGNTTGASTWQALTGAPPTAVANTSAAASNNNTANNNNAYDGAANLNTNPTSSNDEDNVGIDGLININTAPWQVLASLPMVAAAFPDDSILHYSEANVALAHAIVLWRDGGVVNGVTYLAHGPFKSVFDLNNVVDQAGGTTHGFQNAWGKFDPTTDLSANPANGDFSPIVGAPDGVATADWEKKFNTLTRISNLITTRSDTFTCYIVVQGWLNVGSATANPILVAQQRLAFIANRVATGPGNTSVQTTSVPTPP